MQVGPGNVALCYESVMTRGMVAIWIDELQMVETGQLAERERGFFGWGNK